MKQKLMYIMLAIVLASNLVGCTYVSGRYTPSADNAVALRAWKGVKINVGEFTDATNTQSLRCNYKGSIDTIDGESYVQFIRNALISELKFADIYSETAPIKITGRLETVENSSAFSIGWLFAMKISSSNGKSISVVEDYKSNASAVGTSDSTCNGLATAFVPAVQNLLGKIIQKAPDSLL